MLTTHLLSFQRKQSYFEQVEYRSSLQPVSLVCTEPHTVVCLQQCMLDATV